MKKRPSVLRYSLALIPLLLVLPNAMAETLPGKRDSLYSAILKEERVIQVVLPDNYQPGSKEKYDVLYLLDGDSNLPATSAIQHFVENESQMPPVIMVAVFNTDRRTRPTLPA